MPDRPRHRSIRLRGWDYTSAGAYFVTICAHNGHLLFEEPGAASVIERAWREIPNHHLQVKLDAFVIMPNHVHGIVILEGDARFVGARHVSPLRTGGPGTAKRSLGAIVGSFKAAVTKDLRRLDLWDSQPFWQRNYYERIVRDDDELDRIRRYIAYNPTAWQFDHENPQRINNAPHADDWSWLEDYGA